MTVCQTYEGFPQNFWIRSEYYEMVHYLKVRLLEKFYNIVVAKRRNVVLYMPNYYFFQDSFITHWNYYTDYSQWYEKLSSFWLLYYSTPINCFCPILIIVIPRRMWLMTEKMEKVAKRIMCLQRKQICKMPDTFDIQINQWYWFLLELFPKLKNLDLLQNLNNS